MHPSVDLTYWRSAAGEARQSATTSWTAAKLSCGAVRDERSTRERGTRPQVEARRGRAGTGVARAEHGEAAALVLGGPTDARTPGVTNQDASNHPESLPSERERGGRSLGAGARRARRGPYPWPSEPRCLEPARGLPSEQEMGRVRHDLGGPWQRVTSRGLPSPRRGPPPSAAHLWELSRACAFATSAERVSPTLMTFSCGAGSPNP
jgi:hypothetical protein